MTADVGPSAGWDRRYPGWNQWHDCVDPGWHGSFRHHGEPLSRAEVAALPDGAEVVVTWVNGSGPWPYRILVDRHGDRRVESRMADRLLLDPWPGPTPRGVQHRVTLGWDLETRAWVNSQARNASAWAQRWAELRGLPPAPRP